ncbi:MAG: TraU family protein [Candidatus Manganitrophus sp. SB1]|nr:TraU family protein [Candidatus Manganitrophus morganii]
MRNVCLFGVLTAILILSLEGHADARGFGTQLNPVTDICWNCVFPIKIAGMTVIPGDVPDAPDAALLPVCVCPAPPPLFFRPGIPVSFWEPARFIETVKDPFYFPSLGVQMPNPSRGFLGGTHSEISAHNQIDTSTFAQAHYFIFPVWGVLELLIDFVCVEHSGFDLAYITEVDPLWNNDMLAFAINPEALLFANPVAQMSCIADSVAANAGLPLSALYWCMGSWGSAYPLTGHVNDDTYIQANAAIAARLIYKLSRELLVCDTGVNLCGCIPTPIWIKHNYRIQIAKPVRDFTCHPIGRSSMVWGSLKNPPFSAGGNSSDNFLWVIFRKRVCCAF